MRRWIKVALISGFSFSVLFGIPSLLFYYGEWKRLVVVVLFGFFVGFMATPEFDKKAFSHPERFQIASGMSVGIFCGFAFFDAELKEIILFAFIGALMGWFAPAWLKHIPIP